MDDADPEYGSAPPNNPNTEAAMGRVVMAWGVLEQQIDFAIEELYRLDDDLASSITANLGTKAKVEIFQSGAHCLAEFLKPVAVETIDTLVNDTAGVAAQYRNFLAHGRPVVVEIRDGDPPNLPRGPLWLWGKWSARKGGPKLNIAIYNRVYFDNATKEIKAVADRWQTLRAALEPGLKSYDFYRKEERGG